GRNRRRSLAPHRPRGTPDTPRKPGYAAREPRPRNYRGTDSPGPDFRTGSAGRNLRAAPAERLQEGWQHDRSDTPEADRVVAGGRATRLHQSCVSPPVLAASADATSRSRAAHRPPGPERLPGSSSVSG